MAKDYFRIFRINKYIIFSNVVEKIFFFVIFLLLARQYPIEIYGEVVTLFSIANVFIILFDLGLPILIQRKISVSKGKSSGIFSRVFIINLLIFPFYFLFTFLYMYFFFGNISFELFLVVIVTVYLFSISNLFNKTLSGLYDFRSQFIPLFYSRTFTLALFVPAIYFLKPDLTSLLLFMTAGALLQIAGLFKNIRHNKLSLRFREFDPAQIKSILKLSIPLGLAVIFNFLYDKIDIILISKIAGFDQAAFYNVAYGIFKASAIAYSFLFTSGLTRISYISKNKNAIRLFLKKYSRTLFYISGSITLMLFFGAETIVRIIYTDKFESSVIVLKILSFAAVGLALNSLTGMILNGLGFFKMNMNVTLIGLIINVILNLFLIPEYGIAAAAFVTVLTECFIFLGDYFYIRKFLNS